MELTRIASDLLGPMESRVLSSLARLADPVSGRQLARLAEAEPSTVLRYLRRLRDVGLVRASQTPSATLYTLNRRHVFWQPLEDILASPAAIENKIAHLVAARVGDRARVAVFGSVADGRASSVSDYDLLLIPDETLGAAEREALVAELSQLVNDLTGNQAHIIDVTGDELRELEKVDSPIALEWKLHARPIDGRGRIREWQTSR